MDTDGKSGSASSYELATLSKSRAASISPCCRLIETVMAYRGGAGHRRHRDYWAQPKMYLVRNLSASVAEILFNF